MSKVFPSDYEEFIYVSRYARWLEDEQRRETWNETVARTVGWLTDKVNQPQMYDTLFDAIYNFHVMPSMRLLMTAGPAADRCNVCTYNCSYLPINSLRSFDELMYILMCGTGVGFSVENRYVSQLPRINEHFERTGTKIVVADSKSGWCRSLRELVVLLTAGQIPTWDTSLVRPAGARLKTFGGRASGPAPLENLFEFCVRLFEGAKGRRLTSLECHDLCCKIADIVVVGGVRRSAMISLSDLHDDLMRTAKNGEWWRTHPHRALANNSAVYEGKPSVGSFLGEWRSLYESRSGERGIFNRDASRATALRNGRREDYAEFGTNPCSEIILRGFQFCNLSEIIVRGNDTTSTLLEKAEIGSILGTFQSTLTDFKYLRKRWSDVTSSERLLGVSLTGLYDNANFVNPTVSNFIDLTSLKQKVVEVNDKWAKTLSIPQSVATTCVKPSGTVSQLTNTASGLHPRFAPYYIRTVRGDNKDPLTQFLIDQGVPSEPAIGKEGETTVFSFPVAAPQGALTSADLTAIDHLRDWLKVAEQWCEHKPSVTISVAEDEWLDVGAFVFKNFDRITGVSFLPRDDHIYQQAPYQEIDRATYDELVRRFPSIRWTEFSSFEREDTTTGIQEFACSAAGGCEWNGPP